MSHRFLRRLCLLPLLFLAPGCGSGPGVPASSAQLRQALERATAAQVQLGTGMKLFPGILNGAQRGAEALAARRGIPVTVYQGLDAGSPNLPRIVLGSVQDPDLAELVQAMGVELQSAPLFADVALQGMHDRWVLRGEDPQRPGLPITIYLGVSWKGLEESLGNLSLGGRPGLTMYSKTEGRTEFDSKGRSRNHYRAEGERPLWNKQVPGQHILLHTGPRVSRKRVNEYRDRVVATLARMKSWTGKSPSKLIELYLVSNARNLRWHTGETDLAVSLGIDRQRFILLAKGLPDDGGASAARAAARELLGVPVQAWMLEGAGVDAADSWWGWELGTWGHHLLGAQVLPHVNEIMDAGSGARLSQHQLSPARGLFFRYLRSVRGNQGMVDLWRGTAKPTVDGGTDQDELDGAFRNWLAQLRLADSQDVNNLAQAPTFLTGVGLDSTGAPGGGYDGLALRASLVQARELGVDSLSLTSFFTESAQASGVNSAAGRQACEGDAAVAQAMAGARRAGLSFIALQPHYLISESTGYSAWQRRTSEDHWREFFDGFDAAMIHYGLLAKLCGADLLCLGTTLSRPNANSGLAPAALQLYDSRWSELIQLARGTFGGKLTYAADWAGEAENFRHWEPLDYIGVSIFPKLAPLGATPPNSGHVQHMWDVALDQVEQISKTHGKPALFMEFGARSVASGANETSVGAGPVDEQVQLMYLETLGQALAERRARGDSAPEQFGGLFAWKWGNHPLDGGPGDRSFLLQGKPAAHELSVFAPE